MARYYDKLAFREAMGEEVDRMPHDFDALEDWAKEFIKKYEILRKDKSSRESVG